MGKKENLKLIDRAFADNEVEKIIVLIGNDNLESSDDKGFVENKIFTKTAYLNNKQIEVSYFTNGTKNYFRASELTGKQIFSEEFKKYQDLNRKIPNIKRIISNYSFN